MTTTVLVATCLSPRNEAWSLPQSVSVLSSKSCLPQSVVFCSFANQKKKLIPCFISALPSPFDISPPPIDHDFLDTVKTAGAKVSGEGIIETFHNDDEALDAVDNGVVVVDLSHFGRIRDIKRIMSPQLEDFKMRAKFFGSAIAMAALKTKTPSQWWESYGDEHPELQQFAIRVLSLTCSSSGCERNWSVFDMVRTKRRNRLKQKTMNDVVFVMAKSKLAQKKQPRKKIEYNLDDLASDDEWIVDNDESSSDILDLTIDNEELELDNPNEGDLANDAAAAPMDDLEIPNVDDEVGEEDGMDHMEDDYYDHHGLNDLLN